MGKDMVRRTYDARIESENQIYDGDTLNRVQFRLPIEADFTHTVLGEVYPEIYVQPDGVWVHVNVRLNGIDTPERHPHHKYPDGTPRPESEIADEHELAMQARQVVIELLKANDLQFLIRNPQEGKYAGRIVADVLVPDPQTKELVNVSDVLIAKGLGYAYSGGQKRVWDR